MWADYPPPPRPRPLRALLFAVGVLYGGAWLLFGPMTPTVLAAGWHAAATAGQTADGPHAAGLGGGANPPPGRRHSLARTRAHGCDPARDLRSGQLDRRARAVLEAIRARWTVRISCVHTGHSRYVKGTRRTSNHFVWRAVDLDMVDGRPVGPGNRAARDLAGWLHRLDGPLRLAELGSPFRLPGGRDFTDDGHQGHLHLGWGS